MDINKCPFCFRPLGTWQKDPILLPNGCPNEWVSATETTLQSDVTQRIYKGFYQITEPEVQEIQDFLKAAEVTAGVAITTWSPLNTTGKFQITGKHIKEMRDSVEKLLAMYGLTKTDYFNYDEEENLITQYGGVKIDWTDPITTSTDLKKFQVKYIHIEDLRHYIQTFWQETWAKIVGSPSETISFDEINRLKYFAAIPIVQADKTWNNLNGFIQFSYYPGQEPRLHGSGTCNYLISSTEVSFNASISALGVDNSVIDVGGYLGSNYFINTVLSQGYNKDLRLELNPFNLSGSASQGTDTIIIPTFRDKYGVWHDTATDLAHNKTLTQSGGYVSITLYFGYAYPYSHMSLVYYKSFGQNVIPLISSLSKPIEWMPDSNNGRYLFDDIQWLFPSLTPTQFASWELTGISINYRGGTSTARVTYQPDWGIILCGFTDMVGLTMNFDIGTIAVRVRTRP